jgi:mannose-6-phosphate isomerase-like protein (cupin superfamily)
MKQTVLALVGMALVTSAVDSDQSRKPNAAVYITKEEVDTVNKSPGIDRTIKVVDIGTEHFAVGVIHRGPTPLDLTPAGATAVPPTDTRACGAREGNPAKNLTPGLYHDKQAEGYYIISGEGTIVTGGQIVNGRTDPPDAEVTTTLNGPSCRGGIAGADVVTRLVRTGDIVIIPPGVPHGWAHIADHVDYLSFRPSGDILTAGYVHPSIKK